MLQTLEDFMHYLSMFLKVCIIDEDIIHVNCYLAFSYEICEYRVHEGLESGGAISHAKIHNLGFIQPLVSDYSSLPLVPFMYANIVISPSDIKFGEVLCLCQLFNDIGCKRKWIVVFDCDFI